MREGLVLWNLTLVAVCLAALLGRVLWKRLKWNAFAEGLIAPGCERELSLQSLERA